MNTLMTVATLGSAGFALMGALAMAAAMLRERSGLQTVNFKLAQQTGQAAPQGLSGAGMSTHSPGQTAAAANDERVRRAA